MNYIILDLEWNQSSTGQEPETALMPFEIIEIGAIKLNHDRIMVSEFSQLIRPTVYHQMHKITSKLIHMRMEELERGKPFTQVVEDFLRWCGEDYIFCTWGPLDLTELQRNLRYYGMEPLAKGPIAFLDVQKLFSIAYEDRKSRRALEWAVDYLDIEKDIPFHRAFSDAYYTAKVLAAIRDEEVLKNVSYDVFNPPSCREEEIKVQFDTYYKYISRAFPDKSAALTDREVSSSKCYLCRRNLRKKVKWFSTNGRHYYCVAFCEKHGFLKCKVRIRKSEDGQIYVVKTSRFIAPEDVEKLIERRDHARKMHSRSRGTAEKAPDRAGRRKGHGL